MYQDGGEFNCLPVQLLMVILAAFQSGNEFFGGLWPTYEIRIDALRLSQLAEPLPWGRQRRALSHGV